eukprot:14293611-Alexandrium_andersonii.AAC.1
MIVGVELCCQKSLEFGSPLGLFKADIHKANDSLNHGSMARALLAAGVPGLAVTALLCETRS